ncbi:uncharacterized protein C1orf159 homolog isoform X8 [Canis lupus familiaris]|uniref:uncharacterized protein C1orf159 homolog isoform X8 n=1 Tax=Canis lupus familiaris TaxID=9615 RepID=UPI0018F2E482|nr:uncharacterized protein C1orf159 homolog isoform X8 [Canis lupus familiaris]
MFWNMALQRAILLAGLLVEVASKSSESVSTGVSGSSSPSDRETHLQKGPPPPPPPRRCSCAVAVSSPHSGKPGSGHLILKLEEAEPVSSLNAVWTCWPLTPPARAQACVVQAEQGEGTVGGQWRAGCRQMGTPDSPSLAVSHRNLQALPSAGCPCRKVFSPRHIAATDTRMRTAVSAVSAARTAPTALPAVAALLHPPPGPHGLLPTEGLHLQVLEERSLAGVHSSR